MLTTDRNVYKCLDNDGNTLSTEERRNINNVQTLTDGYKWKYIYTLSASQQSNFYQLTLWQLKQTQRIINAVDGAIDIIKIKSAGTGGANGTHTNIDIRGDGTGGKCSIAVSGGVVTATATTAGTGYTFGTVSNAQIVAKVQQVYQVQS